ncbi:MAG: Hsp20/alpha crystallin family protein [Planctomycetota bacterium]
MAPDDIRFLERLKTIEVQLERLAHDAFLSDPFAESRYASLWRPPTDVFETEEAVVVRMEVPGLHVEDISVVIHARTLVVRAVRRDPCPDGKCKVHQIEVHYGVFERVIPLPSHIVHEEADGKYTDGFLLVTIPKCDEAREPSQTVRLSL